MSRFLDFFSKQQTGIAVFLGSVLVLMLLVQWLAWIFRWGRFGRKQPERTSQLRFVIADLFVKIINDFRHLLALVIMLIFAATLAAVLLWAPHFKEVKDGLQVVVAAMGGLVGSIIGYYFGESAAKAKPAGESAEEPPAAASGQPVQDPNAPAAPDIREAPPLPEGAKVD
jgi:hypothetical protein